MMPGSHRCPNFAYCHTMAQRDRLWCWQCAPPWHLIFTSEDVALKQITVARRLTRSAMTRDDLYTAACHNRTAEAIRLFLMTSSGAVLTGLITDFLAHYTLTHWLQLTREQNDYPPPYHGTWEHNPNA